jgi:NAD(P)-dependent dehydrogenase (short-subunit alcohol dehydrogenase family)
LAQEVARFGVKVTLVEPGAYATDWAGSSAVHATPQSQYDAMREEIAQRRGGSKPGDPRAAGLALLNIVDAEQPPLRVLFGATPAQIAPAIYQARLATWEQWKQTSIAADGNV